MPILRVNVNSHFCDILSGNPTGQVRQYMLLDDPHKKLDLQIYVCKQLMDNGCQPYIEVKFVSKYSSREKRIEVVGVSDSELVLYKFTSKTSVDKDATELDRLVKELLDSFPDSKLSFRGELIVLGTDYDING